MSPAFRPLFSMRSAVFTTTLVVAAALLAACSEKSQSLAEYIAAICAAHFRDASSAERPFLTDNVTAMSKMMVDMGITPSGDVDRDFVAMMVPHHQGAIDMAQAELRYGHNETVTAHGARDHRNSGAGDRSDATCRWRAAATVRASAGPDPGRGNQRFEIQPIHAPCEGAVI